LDNGTTEFGGAVAAILQEVAKQPADACHVGDVANDPTVSLAPNEAGLRQYLEMAGGGVLDGPQAHGNLTGRNAGRPGFHQQAEYLQPGFLTERGKGCQ